MQPERGHSGRTNAIKKGWEGIIGKCTVCDTKAERGIHKEERGMQELWWVGKMSLGRCSTKAVCMKQKSMHENAIMESITFYAILKVSGNVPGKMQIYKE